MLEVYEPEAAIIDRETFEAVAALLKRRTEKVSTVSKGSPLAKKIVCGSCGTLFKRKLGHGKTYWVCKRHFRDKSSCPSTQIPEGELHAAFLRVYHKLRLHGEPVLRQLLSDLQTVRERRMLWSMDIFELNKKISDITDQDRMLADMNKLGLVDPDIFISQSNQLARQLCVARQEKERILAAEEDDTIPKTQELLETLEALPDFLPAFDGDIFTALIEQVIADESDTIRFRLMNGLELTETIERGMR